MAWLNIWYFLFLSTEKQNNIGYCTSYTKKCRPIFKSSKVRQRAYMCLKSKSLHVFEIKEPTCVWNQRAYMCLKSKSLHVFEIKEPTCVWNQRAYMCLKSWIEITATQYQNLQPLNLAFGEITNPLSVYSIQSLVTGIYYVDKNISSEFFQGRTSVHFKICLMCNLDILSTNINTKFSREALSREPLYS
jgi:hypothetical protein